MAVTISKKSMSNTKYKDGSYGATAKINKKMDKTTAYCAKDQRISDQDRSTLYPTKRSIDKNYGAHNARDGRAMEKLK